MTIFFSSERCIVKRPSLNDAPYWQQLKASSKQATQNDIEKNILHYKNYGFCIGSIFLKKAKTFVGIAGLHYYPNQESPKPPELSLAISPGFRRNGLGREITKKIILWGFSRCLLTTITVLVLVTNKKSSNLFQNIGMSNQDIILIKNELYYLFTITADKVCRLESYSWDQLNEQD